MKMSKVIRSAAKGKGAVKKVAKAVRSVAKKVGARKLVKGAKKAGNIVSRLAKGKY